MVRKIDTDSFKTYFENSSVITLREIGEYYRNVPVTTVNWRVYRLVGLGVLQRIGKGLYTMGETRVFVPQKSKKMQKIETFMQKKFPFVQYCQWDLSQINSFLQHLINFNVSFVDVEKDAIDSVYLTLKENFPKVMAINNLYDSLSDFNNHVFVRPLISESPMQKTGAPTLEKILVDLAVDKEFISFQGNEIFTLFRSALEQYTINRNTLIRYAARKNKKEEIKNILLSINRQ